jgi:hypothetical protein
VALICPGFTSKLLSFLARSAPAELPNDGQRFVAWYLRDIHRRNNETRDDITDGPDDKQIAAIVIVKA